MAFTIEKHAVSRWLERLTQLGDIIAPTRTQSGDVLFAGIRSASNVAWDLPNPLHPAKEFVLPQTDPIIQIKRNGQHYEVKPIHDDRRCFLVNARSCDVKGIAFLTRMHEMEPADASYLHAANNLTIISLACTTPCPTGFCICTDSGPFLTDSYDAQVTDLGETYLVEVGSAKGEAAVAQGQGLFRKATDDEVAKRKTLEEKAKHLFGDETCHFASAMRRISTGRVPDTLWEKMSDWCLGCGGCNVVCPTCYCFSVKDLGCDGGWMRCRLRDSCQYSAFTLEASGHNPRPQTKDRMKRRFFHKVSAQYYKRDGAVGCVGCGRCVQVCLGATNMPAVVAAIRKGNWHE